MPMVASTTVPTQLHVSIAPRIINIVLPVRNASDDEHYRLKPSSGGLWTSTYMPEIQSSSFIEYIKSDSDCSVGHRTWWLLTPIAKARIYHVDTEKDLMRLYAMYRLRNGGLHYEAMAVAYDALHLSEQGYNANHQSDIVDQWSAESTLWFRWCFSVVNELRKGSEE